MVTKGHQIKILTVSDIHGSEKAMEDISKYIERTDPNVLIVCGDITNFGPWELARDLLDTINIPMMAVPGNCDPPKVIGAIDESNASNLHENSVEFMGERFAGLGGAPDSPSGLKMEFSEQRIYEMLDAVMTPGSNLVTHAPAFGMNDLSHGTHLGSKAIMSIVEKYKPRLALSGHIHGARGIMRYKGTTFVNPGPAKQGLAALVTITDESIEVYLLEDV